MAPMLAMHVWPVHPAREMAANRASHHHGVQEERRLQRRQMLWRGQGRQDRHGLLWQQVRTPQNASGELVTGLENPPRSLHGRGFSLFQNASQKNGRTILPSGQT